MPTLSVTPVDDAEAEVWSLAREVASLLKGLPWILIGGLMVRIIEAEHGVSTEWTTGDVDAVLDIRTMSSATEEASRRLMAVGFEPKSGDPHRRPPSRVVKVGAGGLSTVLSARDARAGILSGATVGGIQRALGSEPLV